MKVYAIIIPIVLNVALWGSGCAHTPAPGAGYSASNDVAEHATFAKSEVLAAMVDTGPAGQAHLTKAVAALDVVTTKDVPAVNANIAAAYKDRDDWRDLAKKIMGWWLPYWMHQLGFIMLIAVGIVGVVLLILFFAAEPLFWKILTICGGFVFKAIARIKAGFVAWRQSTAQTKAQRAETAQNVATILQTQQVTAPKIDEIHAATATGVTLNL